MTVYRLGDVADVIAGQSPPGDTYNSVGLGLPFFQGKADFGPRHPVARVWCSASERLAELDDVLLSIRAPVGPSNVADQTCGIGRGLAAIRARPGLEPSYLAYFIMFSSSALAACGQGSTFSAIARKDIEELRIPVPSAGDQRRIAALLTAQFAYANAARTAITSRTSTNRALTVAMVERCFGPAATGGWNRPTLATLLRAPLRTGISAREVPNGGLPGLSLAAVRKGRLDLTQSKRVGVDPSTNRLVREGCFYIVRGNGRLDLVGRAGLAPRPTTPIVFPDLLIEANLDPAKILPEFFQLVWDSHEVRADVEVRARTASGIHKINLANLGRVCVPIPGLDEQRRVAAELRERLATIDAMESAIRVEREAIDALPAALLRRAFDGLAA